MHRTHSLIALTTVVLLACGDTNRQSKNGDDTANPDAGSTDAGSTDAGSTDAGSTDAGSTDAGSTAATVHTIDPDSLASWLSDGSELLLINTHIPFAGDIPGTDVDIAYTNGKELVAAIGADLDRRTVVYCKSGPMSAIAADTLVAAGYREIYDLTGGMNAWEAAGYELKY